MTRRAARSMAQTLPMTQWPVRPRWRARLLARISTVASCLVIVWLLVMPVLAQDATPAADRFAFAEPRLIDPQECVATPLPVETVTQGLHLEGDGIAQPPVSAVPSPLGQVADRPTRMAIARAVRELIACFNAQDMRRATALMTEHGMLCLYWSWTVDVAARAALRRHLEAPPQPRPPDLAIRLIAVTDVSRTPDGREAALITINDPSRPPPGPETVLVLFTRPADAWLLDDWITFSFVPATEATPNP